MTEENEQTQKASAELSDGEWFNKVFKPFTAAAKLFFVAFIVGFYPAIDHTTNAAPMVPALMISPGVETGHESTEKHLSTPKPPMPTFVTNINFDGSLPKFRYGVQKVAKPIFIRVPGENKLLRVTKADYVAAYQTAFYEAGVIRDKDDLAVKCVLESFITRAVRDDHPDTIIGVVFERHKVIIEDSDGKKRIVWKRHYYSPYDDRSKRLGKYHPREQARLDEVAEITKQYFINLARGKREKRCKGVYMFHSTAIKPPKYHRIHGILAVTVTYTDSNEKVWGQKYYRMKGT